MNVDVGPDARSWRTGAAAGWVAAAAALGAAAVWLGPWALAAVAASGAVALFAQRPLVLVHALILYQPFDALLTRDAPAAWRSVDELLVVVALAAIALRDLQATGLRHLLRHPLLVPLLAFAALGAWSAAINDVPLAIAAAGVYVEVDYVLLALLVGTLRLTASDLRRIVATILLSAAIVAAFVLVEAVAAPAPTERARLVATPWLTLVRHTGPFEHPNNLATYVALPLALAIGLVMYRPRARLAAVATTAFLAVFVLAMGRMAWIAMFVGVVAFVAVHHRGRLTHVPAWLVVVLLLISPILWFGLAGRVSYLLQEQGGPRMYFIRNAAPVVREHVWLGVGPGRFGGVVADRYDTDLGVDAHAALQRRAWRLGSVDNFWLHLLVERGVLGVAAFATLLGVVLWRSHRLLRRTPREHAVTPLAAACFMMTIYHVLYNISAPALESNAQSAMYWLLAGLATAEHAPWSGDDA